MSEKSTERTDGAYNVCSLVVHLAPARAVEAERIVAALPGVEIHGRTADSRLVVTAVDIPGARAFDQIAEINRTPGVVAASLVYHAFDADELLAHDAQTNHQN